MRQALASIEKAKPYAALAIKVAVVSQALAILIVFASPETIFGHDAMSMLEPIAVALCVLIALFLFFKSHFVKVAK